LGWGRGATAAAHELGELAVAGAPRCSALASAARAREGNGGSGQQEGAAWRLGETLGSAGWGPRRRTAATMPPRGGNGLRWSATEFN
jgi:hypothetical protein